MSEFEDINCVLCGSRDTKLVFRRKDYLFNTVSEPFNIVKCRKCSLVYVNPRPAESKIHEYYKEEYYQTDISPEKLLEEKKEQLLLKCLYLDDLKPGKMLDIGCQKGEFMHFMKEKGWDVRGMDFSNKPPNLFNLDIKYADSIRSAGFGAGEFDLITLWGVLEHVYHPLEMLKEANNVLRPGGSLLALVTNFRSLPARLMRHDDIPRHTTLFTAKTASAMFRKAGFEIEFVKFNSRLFGGGHRGILNYCFKLLAGEKIEYIVDCNRTPEKWGLFSSTLNGKSSKMMLRVDSADMKFSPLVSQWADWLRAGFIMIARGRKI